MATTHLIASLADQRGLFETSETEPGKETIETKMLVENNCVLITKFAFTGHF